MPGPLVARCKKLSQASHLIDTNFQCFQVARARWFISKWSIRCHQNLYGQHWKGLIAELKRFLQYSICLLWVSSFNRQYKNSAVVAEPRPTQHSKKQLCRTVIIGQTMSRYAFKDLIVNCWTKEVVKCSRFTGFHWFALKQKTGQFLPLFPFFFCWLKVLSALHHGLLRQQVADVTDFERASKKLWEVSYKERWSKSSLFAPTGSSLFWRELYSLSGSMQDV